MAGVDASMEAKNAWVRRVLGISLAPENEAPPDGIDPTEVRGRLNEIGLRVRELGAAPQGAEIKQRFIEAVQALKAGDLARTALTLDEIEPLIADALSGARGGEAARVIGSAKAWRAAVARISEDLAGFRASVISMLERDEHEPEEIAEVEEQLDAELADITEKLSEGLAAQVDAVINGDPARRAAGMTTIMARIQAVEKQIDTHDGVDAIEDNGVIAIAIREPVKVALNELRATLSEAAGQADKVAA